jgi:ketosteroid isomerase-like protein
VLKQAIALAALAACAGLSAQPGSTPAAQPAPAASAKVEGLKRLNQQLIDALQTGDKAAADRVYGKDFVRISVDGDVFSRAQVLAAMKPPAAGSRTTYESRDIQAFDYGDTVVMTYHSIRRRETAGKAEPDFHYRVADTFVKRKGRWEKAVSAGTPMRQPGA